MIYVDFTKWGVVLEGGVNCLVVSVLYDDGKTFDRDGMSAFIYFAARSLAGKWKPKIKYYDYYAQSQKKGYKVKQIFPYVKVRLRYGDGFSPDYKAAFLDLHDTGKISHFTNRVFASDGGPGEIQVIKKCRMTFDDEYFAEISYGYIFPFILFFSLIHNFTCNLEGHFKVYKTQYWMSKWCTKLRVEMKIYTEWNMFFANLGHNICDGHAGHLKRYEIAVIDGKIDREQ